MAAISLTHPAKPGAIGAFHHQLRVQTRSDHAAVDDAFGGFGLADADGYRRFLTAHALILPGLEAALAPAALIPGWQGRTKALGDDLAALGVAMPAPIWPAGAIIGAARWGALYVVEGSRLGGVLLSRSVGPGLPRAYLSAAHRPGGWRQVLAALDAAAGDAAWRSTAIDSARAVFAAYCRAAGAMGVDG